MNIHIETIISSINAIIEGQSLPSFRTDEFGILLKSITEISGEENTNYRSAEFEEIGRRIIYLMLSRMSASINAEREILLIQHKPT